MGAGIGLAALRGLVGLDLSPLMFHLEIISFNHYLLIRFEFSCAEAWQAMQGRFSVEASGLLVDLAALVQIFEGLLPIQLLSHQFAF